MVGKHSNNTCIFLWLLLYTENYFFYCITEGICSFMMAKTVQSYIDIFLVFVVISDPTDVDNLHTGHRYDISVYPYNIVAPLVLNSTLWDTKPLAIGVFKPLSSFIQLHM